MQHCQTVLPGARPVTPSPKVVLHYGIITAGRTASCLHTTTHPQGPRAHYFWSRRRPSGQPAYRYTSLLQVELANQYVRSILAIAHHFHADGDSPDMLYLMSSGLCRELSCIR